MGADLSRLKHVDQVLPTNSPPLAFTSRSISDFSSYFHYMGLFAFIVSLKPDIQFIAITDNLSAKMSGLSGPNVEEENMWAVTLSGTKREYEWAPEDPSDSVNADDSVDEESDPSFKPNHRLLIKSAILHPEAKKDEVTWLQVETTGYNKEKVVTPFVAMKGGENLQQYVNLLLPDPATIKIISGEGPITLIGSHCVDFYDFRNFDEDEEDAEDAESSEDDEVDMEEQETATAQINEDKSEDKAGDKKKTPKKGTPIKEDKPEEAEKKKTPKKSENE